MVLEDGDFVTPIEGWFFMPSLSRYAEKGGVSEGHDTKLLALQKVYAFFTKGSMLDVFRLGQELLAVWA